MKNIIVFFALFLVLTNIQAQETELNNPDFYLLKGEFVIEGALGFSNTEDERREEKTSSYTINPKAGYLIKDNLVVGLDLSYRFSTEESTATDEPDPLEDKIVAAGIFGRYYFLDISKRFKLYGELGAGYLDVESGLASNPQKGDGFEAGLDLGLNFFIQDNIAISFVLSDLANYSSITYDKVFLTEDQFIEEKTVSSFNADLNVFNNFFQSARFGIMFKF